MIRYGKRLKKSPISIFRIKEDLKYHRFCCEVKDQEIDELHDEVDVKNEVIKAIAASKTAVPRECGSYYIIAKDEYDGLLQELRDRHAKIAALESDLAAVAHESEVRQAEIVRQRDEALAEVRKLKRFQCSEATYDANAVNGLNEQATTSFADFAQHALGCGRRINYAAACAVVLKRELDKAKEANRVLSEKNAELEKPAPPFYIKNCKVIKHDGCLSGWGPQTVILQDGEYVKEHIESASKDSAEARKIKWVRNADGSWSGFGQGMFRDPSEPASKKTDNHAKDEHGCYINSVFDPCANGDNGR